MRTLTLAMVVAGSLVGCIESDPDGVAGQGSGSGSGGPIDISHATPCGDTMVLLGVPTSEPQPTLVGHTFDTNGALFCLELDSRQNLQSAHFAATTAYEQAASSSYVLALFGNGDDTMLREGWDTGLNDSSFANLEYSVPSGNYIAVKLFVAAKSGTATTNVGLSLFEPFE
jgi:hypothetical protein